MNKKALLSFLITYLETLKQYFPALKAQSRSGNAFCSDILVLFRVESEKGEEEEEEEEEEEN